MQCILGAARMPVHRIDDLADPRLADYRGVSDPGLLSRGAIFVAEGRQVVRILLRESGLTTRSVLVTETALAALRDVLEPRRDDLDTYVVSRGCIEELTGFNIHRGCLAVGERPPRVELAELLSKLPGARRLVVLERIGNADNVGGIFRNAAAFGAEAVVLGEGCCDPLYRKAVRVSMGAALRVPFARARLPAACGALRSAGFVAVALTPERDAEDIGTFAARAPARIALLVGSEGEGLSAEVLSRTDVRVRIPMAPGIDSLNVSTAAGIALHRLAGL